MNIYPVMLQLRERPSLTNPSTKTAFNEIHAISDNGTKEEPGETAGAPAMEYLGGVGLALVVLALLLSIFPVIRSSLIEEPTINSLRLLLI